MAPALVMSVTVVSLAMTVPLSVAVVAIAMSLSVVVACSVLRVAEAAAQQRLYSRIRLT